MKTILIITGLILTIPLVSFSQEYEYVAFPDSGVIWSEIYYFPIDSCPRYTYERFAISGEDTVISDITYKKLYIFYDTIFNKSNATFIGGIREDENKKIYFKGDTVVHAFKPMNELYGYEEIILFDFSLKQGDTIKNINCLPYDDRLVVQKVDTILIGNTLRRRFHFDPEPWVKWIEGIGSLNGLLFTSGAIPTNGINNELICFKQDDVILYFNDYYPDCMPLISGGNSIDDKGFEVAVFPNPTNINEITFNFGYQSISLLQVFDAHGKIITSSDIEMQPEYILSTEKYQPGIYFYKATNENGIVHTGKFVVL